jgi:flavin reductase (DIM6/NTAB) family NADH-FMN oxidoreductase RutF
MIFTSETLKKLETRFRSHLINGLSGFKSLNLIGTRSNKGFNNLATFSNVFHLGADPALCGMIVRPDTTRRHTLNNIMENKSFTINHVLPSFFKEAHQCSARYAENISEFDAVGLTPQFEEGIYAPFVSESRIKFACEMAQRINLEINGTILIIGRIAKIMAPDDCISPDGFIDIEKAETLTVSGLDSYHLTKQLARLSYAKPDKPVEEI